MRISELAEQVGVPVSTVRFYERIGLMDAPERSGSGYRQYDAASASPPPAACRTDLSCCVPDASGELLSIERYPRAGG